MAFYIKSNGDKIELETSTKVIYLHYDDIIEMNLSGMDNVIKIHCYGNHLTHLDTSMCHKLETLYCWDNNMTSLDISYSSLLRLSCEDNDIIHLDIPKNNTLYSLYCDNIVSLSDITSNIKDIELYIK